MKSIYPVSTATSTVKRAICVSLIASLGPLSSQAADLTIFVFDGTMNEQGWQIINDGVMGGRSDSSVRTKPNGSLLFAGNVSLENNGGFASTRSPEITADIGSFDGVELTVVGDGNKYKCGLRTDNEYSTVAYQATFETDAGKEKVIRIPYTDFLPTWRGRQLSKDKRLNPADIQTIGFLIADKQVGAFELEVKSIGAYSNIGAEPISTGSDIISIAQQAGLFNTLLAAIDVAGLTDTVRSLEGVTVFAPTDEAFAKLPEGTVASLLEPENKNQLVNILTYHVIESEVPFSSATTLTSATALNGEILSVSVEKGGLLFNDSRVIENDIKTDNGLIHVIDAVLLPPVAEPVAPVEKIISSAIRRGVPLFNAGNPQACADLYELAAEALLTLPEEQLGSSQRNVLTAALDRAQDQHSASDRAWMMRIALDKTLAHTE